jgi:hypothetical protein
MLHKMFGFIVSFFYFPLRGQCRVLRFAQFESAPQIWFVVFVMFVFTVLRIYCLVRLLSYLFTFLIPTLLSIRSLIYSPFRLFTLLSIYHLLKIIQSRPGRASTLIALLLRAAERKPGAIPTPNYRLCPRLHLPPPPSLRPDLDAAYYLYRSLPSSRPPTLSQGSRECLSCCYQALS